MAKTWGDKNNDVLNICAPVLHKTLSRLEENKDEKDSLKRAHNLLEDTETNIVNDGMRYKKVTIENVMEHRKESNSVDLGSRWLLHWSGLLNAIEFEYDLEEPVAMMG